ncbi:hypothetical protein IscW_ISCW002734 [Ixodes scapularis]|uniref:Uncharacterized protein n=1 Tax=Ixodes scapularis TaxID=6945 RepID=B7PD59_IXOSC|nr:hypothetical protein IscW_ISCW002734 [Ixodes scapularis]|eukprot:XP_002410627.1 hypothetical protein IscW_ISCW002734 [Ixodes scapularis]
MDVICRTCATRQGLDKIIQGLEGTWTPAKVARHQETLLATVHRLRESRGRRGRHQLRALQAQRDLALEKASGRSPGSL